MSLNKDRIFFIGTGKGAWNCGRAGGSRRERKSPGKRREEGRMKSVHLRERLREPANQRATSSAVGHSSSLPYFLILRNLYPPPSSWCWDKQSRFPDHSYSVSHRRGLWVPTSPLGLGYDSLCSPLEASALQWKQSIPSLSPSFLVLENRRRLIGRRTIDQEKVLRCLWKMSLTK